MFHVRQSTSRKTCVAPTCSMGAMVVGKAAATVMISSHGLMARSPTREVKTDNEPKLAEEPELTVRPYVAPRNAPRAFSKIQLKRPLVSQSSRVGHHEFALTHADYLAETCTGVLSALRLKQNSPTLVPACLLNAATVHPAFRPHQAQEVEGIFSACHAGRPVSTQQAQCSARVSQQPCEKNGIRHNHTPSPAMPEQAVKPRRQ